MSGIYRPLRWCKSTKLHNCFLQPLAYNGTGGRYDISGHEVGCDVARDGAALRDSQPASCKTALGIILDKAAVKE